MRWSTYVNRAQICSWAGWGSDFCLAIAREKKQEKLQKKLLQKKLKKKKNI